MNYYIKTIWGPDGDNYPRKDNIIKFTNEKSAQKFKECDGFLLYETGRRENKKVGSKAIYGYGIISQDQKGEELKKIEIAGGKKFGWGKRVIIKKRVKTENGIPIERLRDLEIEILPSRGGILEISERQFEILKNELDKISNE